METASADEQELLQRVRDGSLDDFAEIIRRHQQHVFRILSRYERDPHLVEDLAQDTFCKAFKALAQYDRRAPFDHWLSRIAVHTAIDHVRARRDRELRFSDLGDDALDWLQNEATTDGPSSRDAREILELAMRELKPEERLVLTLLEIEEYSIKEISARTGWSSITVRVRAYRARAKLKAALEQLQSGK